MPDQKPTLLQRALRLEPGLSLGQWSYDRFIENRERIAAVFIGGGGMSYLASVTEWLRPWGPVGYGAIGIASALTTWIAISLAQLARAKAALRHAEKAAIVKWQDRVDTINPLDEEFNKQRIQIDQISHPILKGIYDKSFIDCELIGPANIFFSGNTNLTEVFFAACDVIVAKQGPRINNVIPLHNINMYRGKVVGCTIYIPIYRVAEFQNMGANIVSLIGDTAIDAQPAPETAAEIQP